MISGFRPSFPKYRLFSCNAFYTDIDAYHPCLLLSTKQRRTSHSIRWVISPEESFFWPLSLIRWLMLFPRSREEFLMQHMISLRSYASFSVPALHDQASRDKCQVQIVGIQVYWAMKLTQTRRTFSRPAHNPMMLTSTLFLSALTSAGGQKMTIFFLLLCPIWQPSPPSFSFSPVFSRSRIVHSSHSKMVNCSRVTCLAFHPSFLGIVEALIEVYDDWMWKIPAPRAQIAVKYQPKCLDIE